MMDIGKKGNFLIGGILLVIMVSVLAFLGTQQLSIISADVIPIGESGEPTWVINVAPTSAEDKSVFIDASGLDEYVDQRDGDAYIPQSDITVQINTEESYCEYNIISTQEPGWFLSAIQGLFGGAVDGYLLELSPDRIIDTKITVTKDGQSRTEVINGVDIAEGIVDFSDFTDGNGLLQVQSTGGYSGVSACPQAGNIWVAVRRDSGQILEFYTEGVGDRDDFPAEFNSYDIFIEESKFRGSKDIRELGLPSIIISADASFFDYKFIPGSQGKPEIVNIVPPQSVEEGSSTGVTIEVRNTGNGDGEFSIETSSQNVAVSPSSQVFSIEQGKTRTVSFTVYGGSTDEDKEVRLTFEVCSINPFGDNFCESRNVFFELLEKKIIGDDDCGDRVCDLNENYLTCPQDCDKPLECNLPNEILNAETQKCECLPGFEYTEDDSGRKYCKEISTSEDTLMVVAIILFFVLIIVSMLIAYQRMRK